MARGKQTGFVTEWLETAVWSGRLKPKAFYRRQRRKLRSNPAIFLTTDYTVSIRIKAA
jgi:hypothetical protein